MASPAKKRKQDSSSRSPSSSSNNNNKHARTEEASEYFGDIPDIRYNPDADAKEVLVYRWYNAQEVILGKTMEEWLRFSVCLWHTFRGMGADPFGTATLNRPWDQKKEDGESELDIAARRLKVAFAFVKKLGVKYYTFHDRDIAPAGKDLEETDSNLDHIVQLAKRLQKESGIRLLWGTANLFSDPIYMCGAASNPDLHVFAAAAAQVKKAMEVTHELGGENYVFWGGREGYQSLLNTNVKKELDHLAAFFRMAVEHKKKIGFKGQLLIEPKPKEPTKHQYDFDAQTVMGFLHTYQLQNHFKLNIEPNHTTLAGHSYEHDVHIASQYHMLGSIDSNTGDTSLGWDTDQFPMELKEATHVMRTVLAQGGLAPGGLNFDCKVRRESIDIEDMFIGHIGAIDLFARALRCAASMKSDGLLSSMLKERYVSWESDFGKKVESGKATFEDCVKYLEQKGKPTPKSGKQEKYDVVFNTYV